MNSECSCVGIKCLDKLGRFVKCETCGRHAFHDAEPPKPSTEQQKPVQ